MNPRSSLALFALVASCAQSPSPARIQAPSPALSTPGESSDASVAATDATAVARGPCAPDDAACDAADSARLTRALALISTDLPAARAALADGRSARAIAWSAYLAHRAGDSATASSQRALIPDGGLLPSAHGAAPLAPGAELLSVVRQVTDASAGADEGFPCVVFAWEGTDGLRAFGAMYGSTRDRLAGGLKFRCASEALDGALQEPARREARAAIDATIAELFQLFPRPEGTIWTASATDAEATLRDIFLVPSYAPPHLDERSLPAVIQPQPNRAALTAAVGRYLRALPPRLAPMAVGYAAVARARGLTVTDAEAHARVRAGAISALHLWLTALQHR